MNEEEVEGVGGEEEEAKELLEGLGGCDCVCGSTKSSLTILPFTILTIFCLCVSKYNEISVTVYWCGLK